MSLRLPFVLGLTAALPLAVAACSGKSDEEIARENNTYLPADAPPTAKERPIVLDALAPTDYQERLGTGQLCQFTSADGRTLFAAAAAADPAAKAKGLVKLGGDFRTMFGEGIGSPEALQSGGRFSDGNVIAQLDPNGAQAALTVSIADGNEARFEGGQWSCGA